MHNIVIFDTGDTYMILCDGLGYSDGKMLYEKLDIGFEEIKTNISIENINVLEFIHQIIGRIISYEQNEIILELLIDNIKEVINLYSHRQFWASRNNKNILSKSDTIYDESFANTLLRKVKDDFSISKHFEKHTYILFNTLYNMSLVIDGVTLTSNIQDIIKMFPEFVIIIDSISLSNTYNDVLNSLNSLFHKKTFVSIDDIQEKYKAFEKLYELDETYENLKKCKSEKAKVKRFLDWHFTISGNVDKRMKANELYKEILNHLCIQEKDATLGKKRIASYLLEFELQKKRFSDGYYYYGIERVIKPNISLNEIENIRTKDLHEWNTIMYKSPCNISNDDIIEKFKKIQENNKELTDLYLRRNINIEKDYIKELSTIDSY